MKVKRNRTDIFSIACGNTNILHRIFVYLVDCHIKADIVESCIFNIFHDDVISVPANCIMVFSIAINTE